MDEALNKPAELNDEEIKNAVGGGIGIWHGVRPILKCHLDCEMVGVSGSVRTRWQCAECGQPMTYGLNYYCCCDHAKESGSLTCENCRNWNGELNACAADKN